ncbi:uncharacterized protein BJX67DRAFT_343836 [Aspergillus lucknowensis]|uniref:Uncharacterized protein n=1 Tax=Aspergillus lucknowensis TaxID=176173 RepID=A0ABR4M3Q0_9EURO
MTGDDLKKYATLDTLDWQPSKMRRRTVALRLLFGRVGLWACYSLVFGPAYS